MPEGREGLIEEEAGRRLRLRGSMSKYRPQAEKSQVTEKNRMRHHGGSCGQRRSRELDQIRRRLTIVVVNSSTEHRHDNTLYKNQGVVKQNRVGMDSGVTQRDFFNKICQ